MIPTLILLLLRRLNHKYPESYRRLVQILKVTGRVVVLLIIFMVFLSTASSQSRLLNYSIIRNDHVVGKICFTESISNQKTRLSSQSEVKARFVFVFNAVSREESIFDQGILTYSSLYRMLNGKEKANKITRLTGASYQVLNNKYEESLNIYPIHFNMLSLFVKEPEGINQVYSDNFQQILHIDKIKPHQYRIRFPDGNYNVYHYENNILNKIDIHHKLYYAIIQYVKP